MAQVNLGFGNSVIEAFNRGFQERQTEEQRKTQNELEKERLKQQRELAEKQLTQEKEIQDARLNFEKSVQDIQNLILKHKIATDISQTGIVPPGVENKSETPTFRTPSSEVSDTEVAPIQSPIQSNLADAQYLTLNHPVLGDFKVPRPEYQAQQEAKLTEIKQRPLEERATRAEAQKAAFAQQLEELKIKQKQSDDDIAYRRALEVEKLRGSATIRAAEIRAGGASNVKDRQLDRVLSPTELQMVPNGKLGMTYRDLIGQGIIKPLNDAQQQRLNTLNEIERNALELQESVAKAGGYPKYFGAGRTAGYADEATAKLKGGEIDPILAHVRDTAGKLQNLITTAAAGKTLSKTEQTMVESHAVTASHVQTPEQAQSKLEDLIKGTQLAKADLLKESQPNTQSINPTQPKVGDIKTFPNGKKGKWDGVGWEAID